MKATEYSVGCNNSPGNVDQRCDFFGVRYDLKSESDGGVLTGYAMPIVNHFLISDLAKILHTCQEQITI